MVRGILAAREAAPRRLAHPRRAGPRMTGMENVWDYPRPPRLEPSARPVRIVLGGMQIAASDRALRVLETSHPPVLYVPVADVAAGVLQPSAARSTVCEWKGRAIYWDVHGGEIVRPASAWSYPEPVAAFAALRDHVAFYPGRMDACFLGDEQVRSQEGDFYGGWITSDLQGPFKGGPGTAGW
jgi:uncharacterized protein (DUF427 family)